MVRLAQISDLHITEGQLLFGRVDTAGFLERAVGRLREVRPDAVLVTGDLVDRGTEREYERLRALLAPLEMPVHLLLGNHDHRETFRRLFGGEGFVQSAFDVGALRVIALDTNDDGNSGGRLCERRRAWLAHELERAGERPVVIAQHHPPFATGIPFMDSCALDAADTAALDAIVSRHSNVERIVCGHVHRPVQARFGGTIAMTAPSVAHQVALIFDDSPPDFTFEPPAFLLHVWTGGGLVTHQMYCSHP